MRSCSQDYSRKEYVNVKPSFSLFRKFEANFLGRVIRREKLEYIVAIGMIEGNTEGKKARKTFWID